MTGLFRISWAWLLWRLEPLRARFDRSLLPMARGIYLVRFGALYGVVPESGETPGQFRERIQAVHRGVDERAAERFRREGPPEWMRRLARKILP